MGGGLGGCCSAPTVPRGSPTESNQLHVSSAKGHTIQKSGQVWSWEAEQGTKPLGHGRDLEQEGDMACSIFRKAHAESLVKDRPVG